MGCKNVRLRVPLPRLGLLGLWVLPLLVRGGGLKSWVPQWLEGGGPVAAAAQLPVALSAAVCCSWKARVVCAASPAVTGFSVAAGSAARVQLLCPGGRDCRHGLCCSPGSTPL